MKKLSLTLTLAILSLTAPVYAGGTNQIEQVAQTNTVPTTAVQVIDKFGDKLDQYITALASKAGVAADHFYPIFVRQQFITGIFELSLMTTGLICGIWLIRFGFKSIEKADDHGEAACIFGFAAGSILLIITTIAFMCQGPDSVSKVFNPEFNAVQSLVHMVR